MKHDEMMKKLEELYDIAIKTEDVTVGLEIVDTMVRTQATKDAAKG